jgi:hypothetical protein
MTERTRTQESLSPIQGSAIRYLFAEYPYDPGPVIGARDTCSDVVDGTREPHPLNIEKRRLYVEPLDGEVYVNEYSWRKYNKLRPGWATTSLANGCPELMPEMPSFNQRAIRVINGTNPSRASVDLGVTIAELRDAPQLLVRAYGSILRQGANGFLADQFGWAPLYRDIVQSFQVIDHVHNRIRELERLASSGGLRRKIQLDTDRREADPEITYLETGLGDVFMGEVTRSTIRKTWGTARWVPTPPSPLTAGTPYMRARRAVYGGHVDATTAWNLIPWSWMVDWFGNLGDFIQTSRNTVGAERSGPVCLMTETVNRDVYRRTTGPVTVTGGSGTVTTHLKQRQVVPWVMPEFQMPFLGSGRLSILAALGVTKIPHGELPTLADAFALINRQRVRNYWRRRGR